MKGIYAALRSGFWRSRNVFQYKNPLELLSFAMLNTLSISALEEKNIGRFVVIANGKIFEEKEIKSALTKQLEIDLENIQVVFKQNYQDSPISELMKTISNYDETVLVGSISIENLEHDEINLEQNVNSEFIYYHFERGKEYVHSELYHNEIFPIEMSDGKNQEQMLYDELAKEPEFTVRPVNGVATILLKSNKEISNHHPLPIIKMSYWKFSESETEELIDLLKELSIDERWIVEYDYLSLKDFINLQDLLDSNQIVLPQMKSGGSLFYGNASMLNGFRAVTSAIAQLEKRMKGKAILFILDENNNIDVVTLQKDMEGN